MLCRATEEVRVGGREEASRSLVVLLLRVVEGLVLLLLLLLLLLVVLTSLLLLLLTLTSLRLLSLPLVPGLEPPGDSSGTSLICLGISGLNPAPVADLGVGGALFGFELDALSCTLPPPGWAIYGLRSRSSEIAGGECDDWELEEDSLPESYMCIGCCGWACDCDCDCEGGAF